MTSIMKHQAAIALLVAILSNFSNCDYCPVSVPTVSVVSKCPTTKAEWDEAASRKKCSHMTAKCGTKSPVYHCLLNQWGNETVEVCASDWFISGFCAIYNTDEMKVIDDFNRDCTNFTSGYCPTRYISTDAYMYQGCYGKRNTSTPLPSTDKQCFRVHVSTDCTLPAAIIAIIIVLSLLSLILSLLLVLTCRGKISKSVMYSQCMRLRKQTPGKEKDLKRRKNARFTLEKSNRETKSLLAGEQKRVSPRTDKTEEENNTMRVKEEVKQIDASDSTTDTSKKDENLRRVNKEERKPMSFGRTNFPRDDRKSECNVKDEDQNVDSEEKEGEEEGKVIIDERTDSPDNDRKLESIDRVEQEDDRLHENGSKVREMKCMPSNEISAGEKERGSESKSESQKELEIGEENNGEEVFDSNTNIKSSSSSSNGSKNSTEIGEQLNAKEKQNLVKSRVEKFENL